MEQHSSGPRPTFLAGPTHQPAHDALHPSLQTKHDCAMLASVPTFASVPHNSPL